MMLEVIDFFWSNDEEKIIYVSNFNAKSEDVATSFLYKSLGDLGPIYELVIFNSLTKSNEETLNGSDSRITYGDESFCALVKFYSKKSAKLALNSEIKFKGQKLKLKYSNKKKVHLPKILYYKKCLELANYYLGFNGWSLQVLDLNEIKQTSGEDPLPVVAFECVVVVGIPRGSVESRGHGRASESYPEGAPAVKYQMYPRVRKEAYKLAVENAFSQILLVVLDNGKVHVEHSGDQENYDNSELLTVNEIADYPESDVEEFFPMDDD